MNSSSFFFTVWNFESVAQEMNESEFAMEKERNKRLDLCGGYIICTAYFGKFLSFSGFQISRRLLVWAFRRLWTNNDNANWGALFPI